MTTASGGSDLGEVARDIGGAHVEGDDQMRGDRWSAGVVELCGHGQEGQRRGRVERVHDARHPGHLAQDPGVPLRILHTEYSSVVGPIIALIDELRERNDKQIVVLIPVVIPNRLRYRILHNQIDHVLSAALRTRTDVVVARIAMPLQAPPISAVSTPSPE